MSRPMLVGPGESVDLIIDTNQALHAGTYYLYSRNLEQLNNDLMDRGGVMTEITIILIKPMRIDSERRQS